MTGGGGVQEGYRRDDGGVGQQGSRGVVEEW